MVSVVSVVEMLFKSELKKWRGKLYQKEAAAKLDVPLPTYRKWEQGKKTPRALALEAIRARMNLIKN